MKSLILIKLFALRAYLKAFIIFDEIKSKVKTAKIIIGIINDLYKLPIDAELLRDIRDIEKTYRDFLTEEDPIYKLLDDVYLN